MGGSIHIHRTASSIVDTVFVCRDHGHAPRRWLFESAPQLAAIIGCDLAQLAGAGQKPTRGDTRCIMFGHLTRMAARNLRKDWNPGRTTAEKLERFGLAVMRLANPEQVFAHLESAEHTSVPAGPLFGTADTHERDGNAVAF